VFWISDFEDTLDGKDWRVLGKRHELTAISLRDPRDDALPAVGWVELEDLESGERALVNTSRPLVREAYLREGRARQERVKKALDQARSPILEIRTDRSYLPVLIRYFASRNRRRARS